MITHKIRMVFSTKYRKAAHEVEKAKKLMAALCSSGSLSVVKR